MKIKLEKLGEEGCWRADCLDLPGTPPCGDGDTKEMAIACLFFRILRESTSMLRPTEWTGYIKLDEPLMINDEEYKYPWRTV